MIPRTTFLCFRHYNAFAHIDDSRAIAFSVTNKHNCRLRRTFPQPLLGVLCFQLNVGSLSFHSAESSWWGDKFGWYPSSGTSLGFLSCHDSPRAAMICPVLKYMRIQYYLAKLCILMAHISDRGGYLGKGWCIRDGFRRLLHVLHTLPVLHSVFMISLTASLANFFRWASGISAPISVKMPVSTVVAL